MKYFLISSPTCFSTVFVGEFSGAIVWIVWRETPKCILANITSVRVYVLFGHSPVNTRVVERPLALVFNRQQPDWQPWRNNDEEALLLPESLVNGCDSLRRILLTPGAPHKGNLGTPFDPLPHLLMSADVPACMIMASTGGAPHSACL